MIFLIEEIILMISKGMILELGDIIVIGMLVGVGKGFILLKFLYVGDEVVIIVEGIGIL